MSDKVFGILDKFLTKEQKCQSNGIVAAISKGISGDPMKFICTLLDTSPAGVTDITARVNMDSQEIDPHRPNQLRPAPGSCTLTITYWPKKPSCEHPNAKIIFTAAHKPDAIDCPDCAYRWGVRS